MCLGSCQSKGTDFNSQISYFDNVSAKWSICTNSAVVHYPWKHQLNLKLLLFTTDINRWKHFWSFKQFHWDNVPHGEFTIMFYRDSSKCSQNTFQALLLLKCFISFPKLWAVGTHLPFWPLENLCWEDCTIG